MTKEVQKQIKKLCQAHPDEVVRAILESHFWLKDVNVNERYVRYDDDTKLGHISIAFSEDADAWLEIHSEQDPEDPWSHRFRMPVFGGGQSEHTRMAVLILARAIKLDNEKKPQQRAPILPLENQ